MINYVAYHVHTDLSNGVTNIDSVTKYQDYVNYAKECGMKALAFSEHGCVFEWVKKKESIEKAGMKYIHAIEMYVTKNLTDKIRDNLHCVLIAKNYQGVLEINTLSSKSFNRNDGHFYYAPRITLDELLNTSDNVIITTACLGGILVNGDDKTKKKFINFLINNKHRCYLEIQHHNVEQQIRYNQYLYGLHIKYDIPLICGTDTHALNSIHLEGRTILQKAKKIYFENEAGWDLTFKTYDELVESYKEQAAIPIDVVLEAIENTNVMADLIEEFTLDRSYKYPHLWENSEKLFLNKIKQGIKTRGVDKYPNRQEYADRVKHELEAYKHNGAIDFMLLMEDIISWCKTQDIPVGYGRGSVNGSVIAWLLGITEMDSIKHNLNFERFMNVERVSLSDIDTDFPPSRIEDVKNYIYNRNGLYCCDIITFNTIADKGAIRDVGRALEIPLSTVDDICDCVDNEEKYKQVREKYSDLFKYVDIVKGTVVSIGTHPCGLTVSPFRLDDKMGLCTTSTNAYPVSQIYMKEIDSLNYVKLDLLKLDTIELIYNTCKDLGMPLILPEDLDINDIAVWNSMRDDTTCIFQWEGKTGDDYIKKLLSDENIKKYQAINSNVDRMTLLSIGNSAIRPAGASYREDLANGIIRTTGSKPIDEFLSNTFGYLTFQCQILDFLHHYCGFTMGEADIVRRGFAKKTGTEQFIPIIKNGGYMSEENKHYINGYIKTMKDKYGIDEEKSEQDIVAFLKVIEDASSYLFSLNHSQPYSYEGYACAYLRYYHPLEFLTNALNINKDKEEKTIAITNYAKKNNIQIVSPKFRHSLSDYSFDKKDNYIYKGLSSIKNIGDNVANDLYSLKDNEYDSFIDLLIDISNSSINSRQLDILIRLDFFSEFDEIKALLKQVEIFDSLYGKKQIKRDKLEEMDIPIYLAEKYCQKVTEKMIRFDDTLPLIKAICEQYKYPKTTTLDKIIYQKEYLGYISITKPNVDENYYFVCDIDKNIATLYQIKTGNTLKIKFRKNDFYKLPFSVNEMIKITEIKQEPKWIPKVDEQGNKLKDETGKQLFDRSTTDFEDILKSWVVLT